MLPPVINCTCAHSAVFPCLYWNVFTQTKLFPHKPRPFLYSFSQGSLGDEFYNIWVKGNT